MATEDLSYQPEMEQDSSRSLPAGFVWFVVAGLAWVLFELTANSSLVAVVACLKFGWPDFRNGLWLWRRDPNRGRGQTCFFFYLALAFWKISLTTVALTFGILILTSSLKLRFPGAEILGARFSLWLSCGLAALSTWIGCGLAWKRGLKIWVDSTITWSRKHNVWPPKPFGHNRLHPLLLAAGVVAVVVSLVICIVVGVALAENQQVPGGWLVVSVVVMLILIPGGLLVITEQVSKTIYPTRPSRCWNPAKPASDSL